MRLLYPCLLVSSLSTIDLVSLWEKGIRGIIIDLDNTISPWRQEEITEEAVLFISEAKSMQFKLCILSNASKGRAQKIAERHGIPIIAPALKPWKRSFRKALQLLGLNAERAAVIGDQLFTDVLGGNRVGCYTILTSPLHHKEFWGTMLVRKLESFLMKNIRDKLEQGQ